MSLRAVLWVLGAAACCASGEAQSQTRRGSAAAAPSLSILVDGQPVGDIDVRGEAGALLIPKDALVDILTPAFGSDRAAMAQLSKLKDRNGQIAIGALRDAGFVADVDGNRLIIKADLVCPGCNKSRRRTGCCKSRPRERRGRRPSRQEHELSGRRQFPSSRRCLD